MPAETTNLTTTYRIRLSTPDVDALKALARKEAARLGVDLGWCDLVRAAVRKMADDGLPIS